MIGYRPSSNSELVFATVGGVGVEHDKVVKILSERLSKYQYDSVHVRVSSEVIPWLARDTEIPEDRYQRITKLMDLGDKARKDFEDEGIIALGAVSKLNEKRPRAEDGNYLIGRNAYLITSLKRPEEAAYLRDIYGQGCFILGIYSSPQRRLGSLVSRGKGMSESHAKELINRDEDNGEKWGQRTRKTFYLADFFLEDDADEDRLKNQIDRIIDLIFGHPYITPTFDEYAMFQAFSASLRSADLSRQVGAVISINNEIISSGANDCPKFGGGLYWPYYDHASKKVIDHPDGRDYMLGRDTNAETKNKIVEDIVKQLPNETDTAQRVRQGLRNSMIGDLTEFGRMVHAEMEALLNCARNSISCRGGVMYATTFPCHNCAKHIIAAGISKVVYVEPYPKSKAVEFYPDAITSDPDQKDRLLFRPFIGVGPRKFFDLFSMDLSSGRSLVRKHKDTGHTVIFDHATAEPRLTLQPFTFIAFEEAATGSLQDAISTKNNKMNETRDQD